MNFQPYSKNTITFVDGQGKRITVEVSEEIAAEWNRINWRDDYQERKRRAPVKRKDTNGNPLDFDENASSRECSLDSLMECGGDHYPGGCIESFEDALIETLNTDNRWSILSTIVPTLSNQEISILNAEIDGLSSREYEKTYGVPRKTYLYRREKLFSKLRSMIETREREHSPARP